MRRGRAVPKNRRDLTRAAQIATIVGTVIAAVSAYLFINRGNTSPKVPPTTIPSAGRTTVAGPSTTTKLAAAPTTTPVANEAFSYSAPQPGPLCDTKGATWTEVNVAFKGGCSSVLPTNVKQFGFLNITLPAGRSFQADNQVSITSNLGDRGSGYDALCLGLDEESTSSGYMAAFCNDGSWNIYSMSQQVETGTIKSGSIPYNSSMSYVMGMSMRGTSLVLSFSEAGSTINPVTETANITPFQPATIGIGYEYLYYNVTIDATNFTYAIA